MVTAGGACAAVLNAVGQLSRVRCWAGLATAALRPAARHGPTGPMGRGRGPYLACCAVNPI
jgi:hypothetical protein